MKKLINFLAENNLTLIWNAIKYKKKLYWEGTINKLFYYDKGQHWIVRAESKTVKGVHKKCWKLIKKYPVYKTERKVKYRQIQKGKL